MRRVAHLAPYYSTIFIKTCHFKRSLAINIAFKDEISEQKKNHARNWLYERELLPLYEKCRAFVTFIQQKSRDTSSLNFLVFLNA